MCVCVFFILGSHDIHPCLPMVDTELNRVDGFLHQYRSHCASKWVECRSVSCHPQIFIPSCVTTRSGFSLNAQRERENEWTWKRVARSLRNGAEQLDWMVACVRTVRFRRRWFSNFEYEGKLTMQIPCSGAMLCVDKEYVLMISNGIHRLLIFHYTRWIRCNQCWTMLLLIVLGAGIVFRSD